MRLIVMYCVRTNNFFFNLCLRYRFNRKQSSYSTIEILVFYIDHLSVYDADCNDLTRPSRWLRLSTKERNYVENKQSNFYQPPKSTKHVLSNLKVRILSALSILEIFL